MGPILDDFHFLERSMMASTVQSSLFVELCFWMFLSWTPIGKTQISSSGFLQTLEKSLKKKTRDWKLQKSISLYDFLEKESKCTLQVVIYIKKKFDTSTISMSVQAMMMSSFNHDASVYIISCKNLTLQSCRNPKKQDSASSNLATICNTKFTAEFDNLEIDLTSYIR